MASRTLCRYIALALAASVALKASTGAFLVVSLPNGAAPLINDQSRSMRVSVQGFESVDAQSSSRAHAGAFAVGFMASLAVLTAATRRSERVTASRISARVGLQAPSLIQCLEQKKLLSLVEKLKLLSTAEAAGIQIQTVEQLGLLKFASDNKILSTVETIVTNPGTSGACFIGAATLAAVTLLDLSIGGDQINFFQWVIAGALGAPALVLFGAGLVIAALFGGVKRSKPLDMPKEVPTYGNIGRGGLRPVIQTEIVQESVTLLNILEEKSLLSVVEEYRLLSLASSLINRPLTLTESLGVLSTLEETGILSLVESNATETLGAFKPAGLGLIFFALALLAYPVGGPILALLVAAPGIALTGVGIGLGVVSAPARPYGEVGGDSAINTFDGKVVNAAPSTVPIP